MNLKEYEELDIGAKVILRGNEYTTPFAYLDHKDLSLWINGENLGSLDMLKLKDQKKEENMSKGNSKLMWCESCGELKDVRFEIASDPSIRREEFSEKYGKWIVTNTNKQDRIFDYYCPDCLRKLISSTGKITGFPDDDEPTIENNEASHNSLDGNLLKEFLIDDEEEADKKIEAEAEAEDKIIDETEDDLPEEEENEEEYETDVEHDSRKLDELCESIENGEATEEGNPINESAPLNETPEEKHYSFQFKKMVTNEEEAQLMKETATVHYTPGGVGPEEKKINEELKQKEIATVEREILRDPEEEDDMKLF